MNRWNSGTSAHDYRKNGTGSVYPNQGYTGWATAGEIGHVYDYCNFDAGAILVYDSALSDADAIAIESYLNTKYGVF